MYRDRIDPSLNLDLGEFNVDVKLDLDNDRSTPIGEHHIVNLDVDNGWMILDSGKPESPDKPRYFIVPYEPIEFIKAKSILYSNHKYLCKILDYESAKREVKKLNMMSRILEL